jgi:hypothetical protein
LGKPFHQSEGWQSKLQDCIKKHHSTAQRNGITEDNYSSGLLGSLSSDMLPGRVDSCSASRRTTLLPSQFPCKTAFDSIQADIYSIFFFCILFIFILDLFSPMSIMSILILAVKRG